MIKSQLTKIIMLSGFTLFNCSLLSMGEREFIKAYKKAASKCARIHTGKGWYDESRCSRWVESEMWDKYIVLCACSHGQVLEDMQRSSNEMLKYIKSKEQN